MHLSLPRPQGHPPLKLASRVCHADARPVDRARHLARSLGGAPTGGTTHIEIRAADHDVVLHQPRITELVDQREAVAVVEARETQDAIAIYAAGSDERRFARVRVQARVRRGHQILVGWLLALMLAAGLVAIRLPSDDQLVESLALLTFPLTLAGAVVLWREATSLAERLLRPWRMFLVLGISWIWAIALARLLLRVDGW